MTIKIDFECDNCGFDGHMVDAEDGVQFHCQECGNIERVFEEDEQ